MAISVDETSQALELAGIELETLVGGAAAGDAGCWDLLVERFAGLVWSIARSFRLSAADAADVSQTTWLRLAEHIDRIEQPTRVGAWLATTVRRECLRQVKLRGRQVLIDDERHFESATPPLTPPESRLLREERDTVLWRCLEQLPERSRSLLLMLIADPPLSYREISEVLDMPIGSIGPTRARLLAVLRRHAEAAGISGAESASH